MMMMMMMMMMIMYPPYGSSKFKPTEPSLKINRTS